MLIVLAEDHKEHLKFLSEVDGDVASEFCRLSMGFIRKGLTTKVFASAAQKLGVPVDAVRHCVEAIMFLLTESSKLLVSEIDFQDSIMTLVLPKETSDVLLQTYVENRKEIRTILASMSMSLRHYYDLQWRFDVMVAGRCVRAMTNPVVVLKLETKQGTDDAISHLLQTDPLSLRHVIDVLETAHRELKTAHCRRILRNIK